MFTGFFTKPDDRPLSSSSEARAQSIRSAMLKVAVAKRELDEVVQSDDSTMIKFQATLDSYVQACIEEREARSTCVQR